HLIYIEKIKDLRIVDPYNIPMIKGVKDNLIDVKSFLDEEKNLFQ
ncbi:MAG: transposase, partial [Campylobacteraceae bacterium]|nr:transposase [Campylobacteraceae bacterium]